MSRNQIITLYIYNYVAVFIFYYVRLYNGILLICFVFLNYYLFIYFLYVIKILQRYPYNWIL